MGRGPLAVGGKGGAERGHGVGRVVDVEEQLAPRAVRGREERRVFGGGSDRFTEQRVRGAHLAQRPRGACHAEQAIGRRRAAGAGGDGRQHAPCFGFLALLEEDESPFERRLAGGGRGTRRRGECGGRVEFAAIRGQPCAHGGPGVVAITARAGECLGLVALAMGDRFAALGSQFSLGRAASAFAAAALAAGPA